MRRMIMMRMMRGKLVFALALAIALGLLFVGCGGKATTTTATTPEPGLGEIAVQEETNDNEQEENNNMHKDDNPVIEITMQGGGKIDVELDPEAAPITVANFLKLVDQGFYDGLIFHRIIPNFMIQGGDPDGTGTGGADEEIKGEFSSNGWDNPISHKRGVISMARANDPNSASSQFFITNADAEFLDGGYAAFGVVISGMDVVDEITAVPTGANDRPNDPPVIETIRRK